MLKVFRYDLNFVQTRIMFKTYDSLFNNICTLQFFILICSMKKIPWAVKMWEILIDNFSKTFSNWCQIVLKIGENEDVIKDWADTFIKAYEETSQELTTDMERVQNDALLNIEQLLQEFQQLCEMLQTNMPVLGDPTRQLSLCQEQRELKKHIEE